MIDIVTEDRERETVTRTDIIPVVKAIVAGRANDALVELAVLFKRDGDIAEWIEQARYAAKRTVA
ncbi:hypothetical protein [Sphingomonas sp. GC_Shp_3]|uniref:hypothetical protein n=1 Tax=Sphingomonas sp. GC_Shp_3 TaxID=2937383 RepID=UPI00226AF0A1|nr:hypothetical protein [Sphingomonas sp. GC_Shp_3]